LNSLDDHSKQSQSLTPAIFLLRIMPPLINAAAMNDAESETFTLSFLYITYNRYEDGHDEDKNCKGNYNILLKINVVKNRLEKS